MTKQQLQEELLAKVKPGTKPSHLKKLKRSKSEGDIPQAPPLPTSVPLSKSQSNPPSEIKYPYTQLISQQQTIEKLEKETTAKSDTISLLRKKIEDLEKEGVHSELSQKSNPPNALLTEQLTTKQQEIEQLRKQLETAHTELTTLKQNHSNLLDTNLTLKHQSLKDWFTQYQKTKQLDQALKENVNQASQELIEQDQTISQLRHQVKHLELTNQSLQKDLDLATKLAELRKGRDLSRAFSKSPFPNPDPNSDYSQLMIYAFLAFWLISLLNKSWQAHFKNDN